MHERSRQIGSLRENLRIFEWGRYFADGLMVIPAAAILPPRLALAVADLVGFVDAVVPSPASRMARKETGAATGAVGLAAFRGACRRLAGPRRDLVYLRRMRSRRESLAGWTLVQSNPDPVRRLVASKQPFVLAGGHFASAPSYFRHQVLPADLAFMSARLPRWKLSPGDLRRRLALKLDDGLRWRFLREPGPSDHSIAVPDLWERGANWAEAPARMPTVQEAALTKLACPGGIVAILVDTYWDKPTAHCRPFAGTAERGFAVGAARIARLAQCPLVPFVAAFGETPRSAVIDWGCPILPSPKWDAAGDPQVIDQALDFIERGVARYPNQYAGMIGYERRWDSTTETWRDS